MHASVRPALSVNIPPIVTSPAARETLSALSMRMTISKVNFFYASKQVLFDINLGIATNKVTSLIGPSGCGKSTLLRTLNRMYEIVRGARLEGENSSRWPEHPYAGRYFVSPPRRHGLSAPQSVPQIHFRQRGLWPEDQRFKNPHL